MCTSKLFSIALCEKWGIITLKLFDSYEQVRRVQSLVDAVDNLKVRRLNPFSSGNNTVSVTSKWEMFESGVGSLSAPRPIRNIESGIGSQAAPSRIQSSSIKITEDWERFDWRESFHFNVEEIYIYTKCHVFCTYDNIFAVDVLCLYDKLSIRLTLKFMLWIRFCHC